MATANRNASPRVPLSLVTDQSDPHAPIDESPLIGMPATVRVGPCRYTVFLYRGSIQWNGHGCEAICDADRRRIYVSDVPPPDARVANFFHELAHAAIFTCQGSRPGPYDDEEIATMMEVGIGTLQPGDLYQVYKVLGAAG